MYQYEMAAPAKEKDSLAKYIYIIGILMFAGLFHLIQWNQHSLTVLSPKIAIWTGKATAADHYALAKICRDRGKWECRRDSLYLAYQMDPKLEAAALELGKELSQKKLFSDALTVYTLYFKNNGKDFEARFNFAIALAETKRFQEAYKQFNYVLQHNRDKLQHPLYVRTFVKYLMANNQLQVARQLITQTRRSNKRAAFFLEKELQQIDSRLKTSS